MADASRALFTPPAICPAWRRSTPVDLIEAFDAGAARKFARAMRRLPPFDRLSRRRSGNETHPYAQVLWSRNSVPSTGRSDELAELLKSGLSEARPSRKSLERRAGQIADLLDRTEAGPAPDAFELLAWMTVLLHEPSLPDDLFLRLWSGIHAWMQPLLDTSPKLAGRLTPDHRALVLGELPWMYGIVFSGLRGARAARDNGAKHLQRELLEVCDEDGMPQASLLRRLTLCVAPFTRAASLGERTGNDWRNRKADARYRKLVLRSAALLQPDGRTALSNGVAPLAGAMLLSASARAGLKKTHRAALLAELLSAPRSAAASKKQRARTSVAPQLRRKHRPSAQSDQAQLACLRNNWGVGADTCIIAFDGPTPRIELTAFGVPVLSGEWGCSAEGASSADGRWECVCWFSDSNVDYVELQSTGSNGRRVLRQALLSRDDHFLLLCDAIQGGEQAAGVKHAVTLPSLPGATAQRDSLTREWALQVGPLRMRVLPLGLPQSGVHRTDGNLTIDEAAITLSQSSAAVKLSCPLLFDWSPVRRKAPAQWRQSTVAENGRILGTGEATGIRWRIGESQWLYFHSLDGSDQSRTVLGMHTLQETVIGELNNRGDVNHLVQVERKTDES